MADYYPQEPEAMPDKGGEQPDDDKAEGQTALLPKSILGGKEFQPGEEVVLKVVHVYGDEVEVEYAAEEKPASAMAEAEGKLSSMGGDEA